LIQSVVIGAPLRTLKRCTGVVYAAMVNANITIELEE
jgi:hypothetical protein